MKSTMSYFYRAAAWAGVIDKDNALQLAARGGRTHTVTALLEAGADIHAGDDEPLRIAAWWGRTDTVRALDVYKRQSRCVSPRKSSAIFSRGHPTKPKRDGQMAARPDVRTPLSVNHLSLIHI